MPATGALSKASHRFVPELPAAARIEFVGGGPGARAGSHRRLFELVEALGRIGGDDRDGGEQDGRGREADSEPPRESRL